MSDRWSIFVENKKLEHYGENAQECTQLFWFGMYGTQLCKEDYSSWNKKVFCFWDTKNLWRCLTR